MALVTVPGGLWLWAALPYSGTPLTLASTGIINSAGDLFAYVFVVPRDGVLDTVEFRSGTVTNAPDNGLHVSLQDLDANGNPDLVEDQFRTVAAPIASNTWYAPGLITSDGTDTGTKRTVAAGDRLAFVIGFETFVALDSLGFAVLGALPSDFTGPAKQDATHHYTDSYDGATWTKSTRTGAIALKYATDGYVPLIDEWLPAFSTNAYAFNSGTVAADERALRFQVPMSCACDGAWIRCDFDGDANIVLYDSDGASILASATVDASARGVTTEAQCVVRWDPITLLANTTYRIGVQPSTVTSVTLTTFGVNAAALMGAAPQGVQWYTSTRVDAGAWSDVATERPFIGVHIASLDDGSTPAPVAIHIATQSPAIVLPMGVVGY